MAAALRRLGSACGTSREGGGYQMHVGTHAARPRRVKIGELRAAAHAGRNKIPASAEPPIAKDPMPSGSREVPSLPAGNKILDVVHENISEDLWNWTSW